MMLSTPKLRRTLGKKTDFEPESQPVIEMMVVDERLETFEDVLFLGIFTVLINHRFAGHFERVINGTVFSNLLVTVENHFVTFLTQIFPEKR